MSKHTPGPWTVENMKVVSGLMFVADCDGLGDVSRQEDSRANARLIAAAPELLAALKEMLHLPEFDGTQASSRTRLNTKHRARDAINKAEGK